MSMHALLNNQPPNRVWHPDQSLIQMFLSAIAIYRLGDSGNGDAAILHLHECHSCQVFADTVTPSLGLAQRYWDELTLRESSQKPELSGQLETLIEISGILIQDPVAIWVGGVLLIFNYDQEGWELYLPAFPFTTSKHGTPRKALEAMIGRLRVYAKSPNANSDAMMAWELILCLGGLQWVDAFDRTASMAINALAVHDRLDNLRTQYIDTVELAQAAPQ